MRIILSPASVALLLLVVANGPAAAQSVADFYKGKEVRLIIAPRSAAAMTSMRARWRPSRPAHSRQSDRRAAEHAGRRRARRRQPHLQRRSQGRHRHRAVPEHRAARAVLREQAGAVRCREIRLARHADDRNRDVLFWHTLEDQDAAGRAAQEFVAGAAGAASTPAFYGRVFNQIFNFKARFITGYPGQNEILLALESGEVEAMASPFWSSIKTARPTWYAERKVRFLFQYGGSDPHPDLKDVPLALDLLQREPTRRCWWSPRRRSASAARSAHHPAFRPTGSLRCAPP